MRVLRSASKEGAILRAIDALNKTLKENKKRHILLMLSGGSALELLEGIDTRNIGTKTVITVLDERYHTDPAVNNFSQLSVTEFFAKAEHKGADYIDTRVRYRITLKGLAKKFERELRKWRRKYPKGKVIITQGIGPDGHTASIMPFPENIDKFERLFNEDNSWVVGYNATRKKCEYPKRVTVTLPFLRKQVDHSIVFAIGSKKTRAMHKVFAKRGMIAETPARIIYRMKQVTVSTDR